MEVYVFNGFRAPALDSFLRLAVVGGGAGEVDSEAAGGEVEG